MNGVQPTHSSDSHNDCCALVHACSVPGGGADLEEAALGSTRISVARRRMRRLGFAFELEDSAVGGSAAGSEGSAELEDSAFVLEDDWTLLRWGPLWVL